MFASPSQIICTIFGLNIYYYGVILAIAITVGVLISDKIGEKFFGLPKDTIIDLSPYIILFGILGARLYYCLLNYSFYLNFPTEILAIRHGGISIHGAIIGGFIGLIIFAKRHNVSIKKLCDTTVLGLSFAQALGRWGNFFNSEAFGFPTNLPLKLYVAPQYRPIPFTDYEFFHPTFLYESVLDLILFGILFFVVNKKLYKKDGNVALLYLILYSVIRIAIEQIRIDSIMYIYGVPVASCISILLIIVSTILLIINNLPEKNQNS